MKNWLRTVLGAFVFAFSGLAAAQNAETVNPADVYAGPDDSYPVVARVDADLPLQVNGCLNDWSWCDVSFDGNRGWMYAPDIQYGYQGGYVPLYTYAPALGIAVVPFAVDAYWDRYYRGRPWYSQREQWAHREVNHRRPAGPAPSRTLPERAVRTDRPVDNHPQRPMRLGSADRAKPEGSTNEERSRQQQQATPEQRNARPERSAPQDERATPQQRSTPPQREERGANTQRQASPPREQRAAPAEQHSTPQQAERAPAARSNEPRQNESRPNESRQNEPRQNEQRSEDHRDHPQ